VRSHVFGLQLGRDGSELLAREVLELASALEISDGFVHIGDRG
jgi:hypothetical protein